MPTRVRQPPCTVTDHWACPSCRTRHAIPQPLEAVVASMSQQITIGGKKHTERWELPTCCGQVRDATPPKPKPPEACCDEGLRYAGRVTQCSTGAIQPPSSTVAASSTAQA